MSTDAFLRNVFFLLFCLGSTFVRPLPASEPQDAFLTIAYESTDVSHVACLLEFPGKTPQWIGFGPKLKYKAVAGGTIDACSIEHQIDRYVRLRVDADRLALAERRVRRAYRDTPYILGVFDCVTFAIDLADYAGLEVPGKFHYQVRHLIDALAERNRSRVGSVDRLPYPWKHCPLRKDRRSESDDMVAVRLTSIVCEEAESVGFRDRLYLVAYADTGARRKIRIGKLGDGERWRKEVTLFRLPRGAAIGIQLWDADRFNHDDLVFQTSLTTCKSGHFHETQRRGRAIRGSTSIYRVEVSVTRAD